MENDTEKHEKESEWIKTGITGFDALLDKGIPQGRNILVTGGPGTGKTLFCLQTIYNAAKEGRPGLYITFEESSDRLWEYMEKFGWGDKEELQEELPLTIKDQNPFRLAAKIKASQKEKSVGVTPGEGMKTPSIIRGEITSLLREDIEPQMIVVDSLTALSAAFIERSEVYRGYLERLVEYIGESGATSFLVNETQEGTWETYPKAGVEEFLADGVILMHNIRQKSTRLRAIEILKLRGTGHERKAVPLSITDRGIKVFPSQEIF